MASTAAADQISYDDLYARWERGNWRAAEIDFTEDRRDWTRALRRPRAPRRDCGTTRSSSGARTPSPTTCRRSSTPRRARSRSTSSPPSRSTRRATPSSSSASCARSAGSATARGRRAGGDPAAADVGLRQDVRAARQAHRRAAPRPLAHQARPGGDALPRHRRGDARAARPALHRGLPHAARRAARLPQRDAQRRARRAAPHRLRRQAAARPRREDPEVPLAVADLLREVLPYSAGVFVPPGWDRRYAECFGFTLEQIFEEGARSFEAQAARGRAAGRVAARADPLPVRPPARRARRRVIAMLQAGLLGEANGPRAARPGDDGAAVRLAAPRGRPARDAAGAAHAAVGLPGRRAWHLRSTNGDTTVGAGLRRRARRHVPRPLRRLRRRLRRPARPAPRRC